MSKKYLVLAIILILPSIVGSQQKFWIFFKDKGINLSEKAAAFKTEKNMVSRRTLERRAKVLTAQSLLDETDLEVYQPYLTELSSLDVKPIITSRWLNAISAKITADQNKKILQLNFVKNIQPVSGFYRRAPEPGNQFVLRKQAAYQYDYGPSIYQAELINVPEAHNLGLDGSGVLVGMLDSGFNYSSHEAFRRLMVLNEYDFLNNDSTTSNEDGDFSNQQNHGTETLSTIAGFYNGELIGPAFSASYLLAKTEDESAEYRQEEDFWVAGLEWMERQGVDLVSSSLGYNDWYSYSDMNGQTAVTTIAAEIAVKKGVIVVNSMGNEGNNSWRHMIAPADGKEVISVGATDSNGDIANFSSLGPTADGRIKPDVVAMGRNVYVVLPGTNDQYKYISGTSFSCPLVVGVAAMVLQAHPYLKPTQVKDALRMTASRAQNPDNIYGWGMVNALDAIYYHGLFFSSKPEIEYHGQQGLAATIKIFSRQPLISDSLFMYYAVANSDFVQVPLIATMDTFQYRAWIPQQPANTEIKLYFYAADETGNNKFHPYKSPDSYFTYIANDSMINIFDPLPEEYRLYQNYPNPFIDFTKIEYDIFFPTRASISIYNILGQKVRTLINDYHSQDRHVQIWDGLDDQGIKVAAGIYFCRLQTENISIVKRMVFLGLKK